MSRTIAHIHYFICSHENSPPKSEAVNRESENGQYDISVAATLVMERFNKLRANRIELIKLVRHLLGHSNWPSVDPFKARDSTVSDFLNTLGDSENRLLIPSFESCILDNENSPTRLEEVRDLVAVTVCSLDEPPRIILRAGLGLEPTLRIAALCVADAIMDLWESHGCPETIDNSIAYIAKSIYGAAKTDTLPEFFRLSEAKQAEITFDGRSCRCLTRTSAELRLLTYFLT